MSDRDDDQRDDDEKCVPEVQVIRHTLLILFIVAVTDSPAEIFVLKNVGVRNQHYLRRDIGFYSRSSLTTAPSAATGCNSVSSLTRVTTSPGSFGTPR
jgi:hypothetical protein